MTPGAPDQSDVKTLQGKLGTAFFQLRYLPRVWALVFSASKGWAVAWAALLVVGGLIPVATVYLTRLVVDAVVEAIAVGGTEESIYGVVWPAALMGGTFLVTEIIGSLLGLIREYQAELIKDEIVDQVHKTSTAVDLAFYETPDYFDNLHRARNEARYRPLRLVDNAGAFVQSGITLIAMAAVLLSFSVWVPLVLLVSTLPALFVVARHAVKQHRSRLKFTADERRAWYYDHEMTSFETAAELRLFSLRDLFLNLYRTTRKRLRTERLRLLRQQSLAQAGAAVFALLAAAGCMAWMGFRTLKGLLTLGELALFYTAFRQGQQMMRSLLSNAGDIYRNVLFLGDLFEFLGLKPEITDPVNPAKIAGELKIGISFKDVAFSYSGSDRESVEAFNLEMESGKMVAIVGPNGSGKSTVMRLLCRLYDPKSGKIEIDGIDLKEYAIDDIRRAITVLFQKPVQYSFTAAKNIELGDLEYVGSDGASRIEKAACAAGFDGIAAKLHDGYETLLGKWFEGGSELSVGEWQRVALARALLRQSPIVVLDEPTSAMDSWAETDWMERLREAVKNRTTMIITHRFTTAMRADVIHVMRDGCIVESGSHEELLTRGGYYAESWKNQMATQTEQS